MRPIMLCRCFFNGQCPVMSPTKILNLGLGSLSKYLVNPGLGFFSHILDWRQAVSRLHEVQCDLNNHSRSLCLTLEGANGRQGSGPTKAELDPALASASASSFPWIPQCIFIKAAESELNLWSNKFVLDWVASRFDQNGGRGIIIITMPVSEKNRKIE
jgi:hypothetical protein